MEKLEKFLGKLSKKEQKVFQLLLLQIKQNYQKIPNLKPLTGMKKMFRIRFGRYRIIFLKKPDNTLEIWRVTKRDEQTYRNL